MLKCGIIMSLAVISCEISDKISKPQQEESDIVNQLSIPSKGKASLKTRSAGIGKAAKTNKRWLTLYSIQNVYTLREHHPIF